VRGYSHSRDEFPERAFLGNVHSELIRRRLVKKLVSTFDRSVERIGHLLANPSLQAYRSKRKMIMTRMFQSSLECSSHTKMFLTIMECSSYIKQLWDAKRPQRIAKKEQAIEQTQLVLDQHNLELDEMKKLHGARS